ncbi:MAG: DUF2231 domain-containing protein [Opitutaceae bacterium]|jgi:uncharacterized membrane protein
MDSLTWAQAHGALVHFPVALSFFALFCETGALIRWHRPVGESLRVAGGFALLVGAAGSCGAVVSGLVLTRGELFGHGELRLHHVFGWPAFALLIALAVWRISLRQRPSRTGQLAYLLPLLLLGVLMAATAHWGGRLALAYP